MNLTEAQHHCAEQVARAGSSFTLSFYLLAAEKRRAMTAYYAYCRELDDIVDHCREPQMARLRLAWWRQALNDLYAGRAGEHPILIALAPVIERFALPQEELEALIDGMEMDLNGEHYPDFRALGLYCHRVAGVVGMVTARILGYRNPHTLKYAARMGLALQLINILRDIGEDCRNGRIYIPADELARFGVVPEQLCRPDDDTTPLSAVPTSPRGGAAFRALAEFQYERAARVYAEALALLPAEDRHGQRAGLAMGAVYRSLLEEIRRAGFPVREARVGLPKLRKAWIIARVWLLGLRRER